MDKKKKVIVKIQDIEYTIVGLIDQNNADKISGFVNDMIKKVRRSNPFMNKTMTFVLTCVNLADDNIKLKEKNEELNIKLEKIDDIKDLKEQLNTYKDYHNQNNEIIEELKLENKKNKKEFDNYKEFTEQIQRKVKQYQSDLEESRKVILDLQNQLFESQIELVKTNKKSVEGMDEF